MPNFKIGHFVKLNPATSFAFHLTEIFRNFITANWFAFDLTELLWNRIPQLQLDLHLIWRKNYSHGKKSSNQLFSNLFTANVIFTKFLSKQGESKFPQFSNFVLQPGKRLVVFARFHIIFWYSVYSAISAEYSVFLWSYTNSRKRIFKRLFCFGQYNR